MKPVIGATLPLARMGEAHELLENRRSYALRGKVAIDVAGDTVTLPRVPRSETFPTPPGSRPAGEGGAVFGGRHIQQPAEMKSERLRRTR
ncbi:hypothetical protein ABQF17_03590 [Mycolicibacterium elephantis]|uniref:hypothetical protein n=1 Tax=Mycolicibacterium elephantis TaxID=81858 RepID=UPI0009ECC9D3|nr:hypothetical protein [Mycolicibacterium elephantis]